MVSGHHHDAPDAGTPERPDHAGGVGPDRIVDQQSARNLAVNGDEHARGAVEHRSASHVAGPTRQRRPTGDERRLPQRDPVRTDVALDPGPVLLDHRVGELEFDVVLASRPDHRAREHVRRHLIERGRQAEQLIAVDRPERFHVGHGGHARRQGAGLVEHQHRPPSQGLEGTATLDDDPSLRGAGDARHDRDRDGEDQRARRRDHHDREEAQGVTRDDPGAERDDQRDRDEDRGVSIGETHRRALLLLGRLHEPHDARIRAVLRGRRGPEVEPASGVDGARADEVVVWPVDRPRLPRQRRFVEHGVSPQHAVDRHDLARLHEEPVTLTDLVDRHRDELFVLVPRDHPRCPGEQ
jgi:hypothetical protein